MAADRAPRRINESVSQNKMAAGPQGLDLAASVALRSCVFCLLLLSPDVLCMFFCGCWLEMPSHKATHEDVVNPEVMRGFRERLTE